MRKLHLALLLAIVAIVPALWVPARGQTPIPPQVLYAHQRQIAIPFEPDPAEAHRLKQLQLYYSKDQGRTWHLGATAAPELKKFNFVAEGDGLYLFAVQTTDLTGRNYPEKMENVTPGLRVVIDTTPPTVSLRPLTPSGNQVGVAWDIRDDNFDPMRPDAVRLEYRAAGNLSWIPLFPARGVTQYYWAPGTNGLCEVKLRATDLAGNAAESATQVSLVNQGGFGGTGAGSGGFDTQVQAGAPGVTLDPNRKFINTKRVTLNYKITDKGPSGLSGIDLWYTTDGRNWTKYLLSKNAITDPTFENGPLIFDVQGEGVYGFTLIPKSGVGISPPAPAVGEKPQVWIEVDLTKPFVELQSVLVGQGDFKGKLSISWLARDKNFGKTPISLFYATSPEAQWNSIAANQANTGRYVWTMPVGGNMPWQFYIKVQAVDMAGNVGEAITPGLVKVDTLQPKATITDVQPGG